MTDVIMLCVQYRVGDDVADSADQAANPNPLPALHARMQDRHGPMLSHLFEQTRMKLDDDIRLDV